MSKPRRGLNVTSAQPDDDLVGGDPERARAVEALRQVWDPELALDVVSMGLVYELWVTPEEVRVAMTLTTPGCPVSEQLPEEAQAALAEAFPDRDARVELVWDPPWTPERLSPEALEALGMEL